VGHPDGIFGHSATGEASRGSLPDTPNFYQQSTLADPPIGFPSFSECADWWMQIIPIGG
jgi:hypothetical protein